MYYNTQHTDVTACGAWQHHRYHQFAWKNNDTNSWLGTNSPASLVELAKVLQKALLLFLVRVLVFVGRLCRRRRRRCDARIDGGTPSIHRRLLRRAASATETRGFSGDHTDRQSIASSSCGSVGGQSAPLVRTSPNRRRPTVDKNDSIRRLTADDWRPQRRTRPPNDRPPGQKKKIGDGDRVKTETETVTERRSLSFYSD